MEDFEKLGAFYLGRRYSSDDETSSGGLTLYDSKDLTTHAVIIGMTGSGKTGLGVALIEEAAIDHVPVIAIDPKGDLGNLLLKFPSLAPADFAPWIDSAAAASAGQTVEERATETAAAWRKGLAEWGQSPERIAKLDAAADTAIYTPGSTAGRQIAVLREFSAPPRAILDDPELANERVQATALGLLTLLGIDADPLTSREHILISNILSRSWASGTSLDLAGLIAAVQKPSFDRIGVMDLETFYPASDRFALAMRINNLLAAPGFDVWLDGEPLDIDRLLHADSGKPRVSVLSIAHLGDAERMFFVTTLLTELVAWMRRQPGSASLRAVLYMDEVAGFLPPVANPPSKALFLTLLKQARAFGLGLILATQNPVDLDYKALSNAGTWMIGRLQTDRDKDRVREALLGAAGGGLDVGKLDAMLSSLPKRCFLLHNVHESAPELFRTRWVLSYLAGPLSREQIRRLAAPDPAAHAAPAAAGTTPAAPRAGRTPGEAADPAVRGIASGSETGAAVLTATAAGPRPVLPPDVEQWFVPATAASGDRAASASSVAERVYVPHLLALVRLQYSRARPRIDESREVALLMPVADSAVPVSWDEARELDIEPDDLRREPGLAAGFARCPPALSSPQALKRLATPLKRWVRAELPLRIYHSEARKAYSEAGESERDFRIRLQQLGNEARDREVGALRKRYEATLSRLNDRLLRARQAVAREAEQARGAKLDTAISFGTALLGAVLGRKAVSVTSATRVGSAVKRAGRARQQALDVDHAKATVADIEARIVDLEAEFDADVDALEDAYDAQRDELEETEIKAKSSDIELRLLGVGWALDA